MGIAIIGIVGVAAWPRKARGAIAAASRKRRRVRLVLESSRISMLTSHQLLQVARHRRFTKIVSNEGGGYLGNDSLAFSATIRTPIQRNSARRPSATDDR